MGLGTMITTIVLTLARSLGWSTRPFATRPFASVWQRSMRGSLLSHYSVISGTVSPSPGKRKKKSVPRMPLSKMSEEDAREELLKLDMEIDGHAKAYYEMDSPEISDAAFDKLVRRAQDLEGKFETLQGIVKHLNRVGSSSSTSKFAPFNHTKSLLSLSNALNNEELDKFFVKCSTKIFSSPSKSSSSTAMTTNSNENSIEYMVEPKIDGLSLALHYRDGQLVGAGTRGDGSVGENVTTNALMIKNVPKSLPLPVPSFIEIRGEVYISTADFLALNEKRIASNLSVRATPRNAAAGTLRQLDATVVRDRNLLFFAYELRGMEIGKVASQKETLDTLTRLGFSVATPWKLFSLPQETEALKGFLDAMGGEMRSRLGFDTDGAVVKINRFDQREILGQQARYPNWAVAYKFQAQEADTVLKDIIVQVGRTGVLTPVAVLQRVQVGGVFVERATLHNELEIRRLGLRPGLSVRIKRTGDVIPKVIGVIGGGDETTGAHSQTINTQQEPYSLPCTCPVCGSPTEREEGGILVRCTGDVVCSAQAIEKIRHFCSRDAADIEGLGIMTAEELYTLGLIKSPLDVFRLRKMDLEGGSAASAAAAAGDHEENLLLRGKKGWGDRSVNKLLAAIDKRRILPLERFIYALGIRHVGQQTAKDLARKYHTFESLWSYLKLEADATARKETDDGINNSKEGAGSDLLSIQGIGPKAAAALVQVAIDSRSRALVEALCGEIRVQDYDGPSDVTSLGVRGAIDTTILKGQTVVFTGKMQMITRKRAEAVCSDRGANVGKTVTRDTTLLVEGNGDRDEDGDGGPVTADIHSLSVKAKKARALGVKIVSEKEFLELYNIQS